MPKLEKRSVCIFPFVLSSDEPRQMNTGEENLEFNDNQASRRELAEQSAQIVQTLKLTGRDLEDRSADAVCIGEHSFSIEHVERYKASRFIPSIEIRDRRPLRNGLTYWLASEGPAHVRFAVITSGRRVEFGGDLRSRFKFLNELIERWARAVKKEWGVKLIFKGLEYTVSTEGVHLHANILYSLPCWLPPAEWEGFLTWNKAKLGVKWLESGEIRDVREVVKYMVKPTDLLQKFVTPARLAWLYDETRRARYMSPLGDFKEWWAGFDRDHKAIWVSKRDGAGTVRKYLAKVEKHKRKNDPADRQKQPDQGAESVSDRHRGENVIAVRGSPQTRFCKISESVQMILNFTLEPQTKRGRDRLKRIMSHFVETHEFIQQKRFEAGRARLAPLAQAGEAGQQIRVHTRRLIPRANEHVQADSRDTSSASQAPTYEKLPLRVDDDYRALNILTGEILFDPVLDDPRQAAWLAERRRRRGEVTPREAREAETARLWASRVWDGVGREVTWQEQLRSLETRSNGDLNAN